VWLCLVALLRRPDQCLADNDPLAVEGRCWRAIEVIAKCEGVAYSPAERVVIRPGQKSIPRQPIGWLFGWHRPIVSHPPLRADCRSRPSTLRTVAIALATDAFSSSGCESSGVARHRSWNGAAYRKVPLTCSGHSVRVRTWKCVPQLGSGAAMPSCPAATNPKRV